MIRILFVDDEANVLQAMQRTLHGMRNEWSMVFVSSGAAALDELAKTPADLIVSDMRMPGMDGWELLTEVKRLYPRMARLILSGHAEPSSIMRAVGVAHQYLAKPCESAVLKAVEAHHGEVGAYLLGLWGFPNSIVEAVAFHHSPSQTAGVGLCLPALIHIADRLVHQRHAEYAGSRGFGLEPQLLETLDLVDHWPEWLAALNSRDFVKTAA